MVKTINDGNEDQDDVKGRLTKVAFSWAAIAFIGTILTIVGGPSIWQILNAPSRVEGLSLDIKEMRTSTDVKLEAIKQQLGSIALQQKDIDTIEDKVQALDNWKEAWRAYSTNLSTTRNAQLERLRSEIQLLYNRIDEINRSQGRTTPTQRPSDMQSGFPPLVGEPAPPVLPPAPGGD